MSVTVEMGCAGIEINNDKEGFMVICVYRSWHDTKDLFYYNSW